MTLRHLPPGWPGGETGDDYGPDRVWCLPESPRLGLGGNGAAAAYVLGMLGVRVVLNSPVGDDAAGRLVQGWLAEANVEPVVLPGRATMFAVTPVDARSQRLVCAQFSSPPVDWRQSARHDEARWLLLAVQSQVEADAVEDVGDALRDFRSRGGVTVLDTGAGWMRSHRPEAVTGLWSGVDWLIGTLDELRHWTRAVAPAEVAGSVLDHGARRVVIKMGADGAAWMGDDRVYGHQPARRLERSGVSIGAGDGFNGALVARLLDGAPVETAVAFAQTVATKIVEIGNGVIGWGAERGT